MRKYPTTFLKKMVLRLSFTVNSNLDPPTKKKKKHYDKLEHTTACMLCKKSHSDRISFFRTLCRFFREECIQRSDTPRLQQEYANLASRQYSLYGKKFLAGN